MPQTHSSATARSLLVGRAELMSAAKATLSEERGLVFRGSPGVGKTRLLTELAEYSVSLGRRIASIVATESGAAVPLGAFLSLGPARQVKPSDTVVVVADQLRRFLVGEVEIIFVDDAQWLDSASAGLLLETARAGIPVVATLRQRSRVPDAIEALWRRDLCALVSVSALNEAQTGELLALSLEGAVDVGLTHAVFVASEGNPLYIREILAQLRATEALEERRGIWTLTRGFPRLTGLSDALALRFDHLDADTARVIELVALAESMPEEMLSALSDVATLDAAEGAGLITSDVMQDVRTVRMAHPMYREAVRSEIPPGRRARLFRELVNAAPSHGVPPITLTRWRLEGHLPLHADELLTAAELVHATDAAASTRLTDAAGELVGDDFAARLRYATMLAHLHRWRESEEVLVGLDEDSVGADQRLGVLLTRAFLLAMPAQQPARALTLIDAGIAELGPHPMLLAHRSMALLMSDRITEATIAADRIVSDHNFPLAARSHAGLTLGSCHLSRADISGFEQLRPELEEWLTDPAAGIPEGADSLMLLGVYRDAIALEDPVRAIRRGMAHYDRALSRGDDGSRGQVAQLLGWAHLLAGDVDTAIAMIKQGLVASGIWSSVTRAGVGAHYVHALCLKGELQQADALMIELRKEHHAPYYGNQLDIAEAAIHAARGDRVRAAETARRAGDAAGRVGHLVRARLGWYAGLRYGDRSAAVSLVRSLSRATTPHDIAVRAHAQAWLAGDPDALERAAAGLEIAGLLWYAIEAQAQAVSLLRARGKRELSIIAAGRLATLRARGVGLRMPHLAPMTSLAALTPRELQIARLAAMGWSDRRIAESEGLSVRTVGSHLGRVYAKLTITGRSQLGELVPTT